MHAAGVPTGLNGSAAGRVGCAGGDGPGTAVGRRVTLLSVPVRWIRRPAASARAVMVANAALHRFSGQSQMRSCVAGALWGLFLKLGGATLVGMYA